MGEKINSDYQNTQEIDLRQNGATGKLRMIDMCELPVVHVPDPRLVGRIRTSILPLP
jgi:hypothetical protein